MMLNLIDMSVLFIFPALAIFFVFVAVWDLMTDIEKQTFTIEICSDQEWLKEFGPLSDVSEKYIEEASQEWWISVIKRIESLCDEAICRHPRNEKQFCHGWNGAYFVRKGYGLGTLSKNITDEQWGQFTDIAIEEAERVVKEYALIEEQENDFT